MRDEEPYPPSGKERGVRGAPALLVFGFEAFTLMCSIQHSVHDCGGETIVS